jgi:chromosomal replication initiator protein
VDSSNLFAYAAASSVADHPGENYNPLFIYGGSGLGKTHLLLAVAQGAHQYHRGLTVRYCTSEGFVQEFIRSVSKRKMEAFRRRFRAVDMLIMDDFQFLQGKEQSLEEFFWTLDSLQTAGKHVVLGCDRPPRDLDGVSPRTRSRISAGLITELAPPSFETRMAILQRLQRDQNTPLGDDVLGIVADRVTDNIRDLIAAMQQLHAYAKLTKMPVTPQAALHQLVPMSGLPPLQQTPERILAICADAFDTTIDEILHHNRRPLPTVARQVAMYLVREVTDLPFSRIGSTFKRGHSTIISAHRRVLDQMSRDQRFAEQVTAIYEAVNNP